MAVGIPTYNDLINANELGKLKNYVQDLNIAYKKIANDAAVANRESPIYENYIGQYFTDMKAIIAMRDMASNIINMCDEINFIISRRSLEHHLYNFDDFESQNESEIEVDEE